MKEFSFYDVTISEVVLKGEEIFAKTRLQAVEKLISTVNESHDFTFDLGNPIFYISVNCTNLQHYCRFRKLF